MRTHIVILVLVFILIAFLTACATPYKPEGFSGGYSDLSLNKNTYKVSFRGKGFTSLEKVQKYLLYRAAEIARQHGCRYFVILASNIDDKASHNIHKYKQSIVIRLIHVQNHFDGAIDV